MIRLENLIVNAEIIAVLLLIQNWYDWLNYDPLGHFIFRIVLYGLLGIFMYFVLGPLMLRKLEEKRRVRDGDQDEWKQDS